MSVRIPSSSHKAVHKQCSFSASYQNSLVLFLFAFLLVSFNFARYCHFGVITPMNGLYLPPVNTTTADGNGALFLDSPNLSRPFTK